MSTNTIYDDHYIKMNKLFKSIYTQTKLNIYEFLFAISFLVNFILGRFIHFSAPDEEVYNYYNNKRNILNQWFVKKGWGWTTLVIIYFIPISFINNTTAKQQLILLLLIIITTTNKG